LLEKLDEELTILRPDDIVSPQFISRRVDLPSIMIRDILMDLVGNASLGVRYIIFCNNDDKELQHAFEFPSPRELNEFILGNDSHCPECGSPLNVDGFRIAFVKKDQVIL
jgi:hypothetical protein